MPSLFGRKAPLSSSLSSHSSIVTAPITELPGQPIAEDGQVQSRAAITVGRAKEAIREKRRLMMAPLFYVPNLIGYVRLVLLGAMFGFMYQRPLAFSLLYALGFTLDFFDGLTARLFDQSSEFGAIIDVVIDNISRQLLWSRVAPSVAPLIACVEWLVFAFTNTERASGNWKEACFAAAPWIVRKILSNNFRTLPGTLVISGLMFLPLWAYLQTDIARPLLLTLPLARWLAHPAVGAVLAAGRAMALLCELWVVAYYVKTVLEADGAKLREKKKQT
ncbi:unnamed protein product [Vitrella brassicaformis CCMP3155]|uniref:CDP-diacylglycerol--inositol 3-phosphatidyltransferase n=1 Tax=Vitrella brassicaformis (strain CCMP3155) TaxID=1169540 RepID=A0A0G4ERU7_VITBC|nr:unnamed protein product [Vitrella brassicaformis CCMP3155]|eukprot:CEM00622.1 unnamed protein product [Vitrella brassicaformis CCMP3155]